MVYKNQVKDLVDHSLIIPLKINNIASKTNNGNNDCNITDKDILKKNMQMCKNRIKQMKMSFFEDDGKKGMCPVSLHQPNQYFNQGIRTSTEY